MHAGEPREIPAGGSLRAFRLADRRVGKKFARLPYPTLFCMLNRADSAGHEARCDATAPAAAAPEPVIQPALATARKQITELAGPAPVAQQAVAAAPAAEVADLVERVEVDFELAPAEPTVAEATETATPAVTTPPF